MQLLTILPVFFATACVSAHGIVQSISINGKQFIGPQPNQGFRDPGDSVIRQVQDNGPVSGAKNPAMSCGTNAKPATLHADVNPGDEILLDWGQWPHRVGPVIDYLARCEGTTCDKFDSSTARWFKIAQQGKVNGEWVQAGIAQGQPARVRIPANLAPGNYLLRHELLALHNGVTLGGAEFYPSCTQLRVGGSGTARPRDSDLVSFPGPYEDNHPGIHAPGIFGNGEYVFPGPPVASLAAGGGGGGNDAPAPAPPVDPAPAPSSSPAPVPPVNPAPAPSSSPVPPASPSPPPSPASTVNNGGGPAPAPTPDTPAPPSSTPSKPVKVCKVRKSRTVSPAAPTGFARRQHSRIMKRFASSHSH